jgi:hypothetical protein
MDDVGVDIEQLGRILILKALEPGRLVGGGERRHYLATFGRALGWISMDNVEMDIQAIGSNLDGGGLGTLNVGWREGEAVSCDVFFSNIWPCIGLDLHGRRSGESLHIVNCRLFR